MKRGAYPKRNMVNLTISKQEAYSKNKKYGLN